MIIRHMSLEEVIRIIKEQSDIEESVKSFLFREEIPAFKSKTEYKDFLEMIRIDFLSAEEILIAGSGNWGYSFNPDKKGKAFDLESDIDVVIVSSEDFLRYWEEIRKFHRTNYYSMQSFEQLRIKRTGENIYS